MSKKGGQRTVAPPPLYAYGNLYMMQHSPLRPLVAIHFWSVTISYLFATSSGFQLLRWAVNINRRRDYLPSYLIIIPMAGEINRHQVCLVT